MDGPNSIQKSPQLTPEQKRRMEENRKRALEKLQQKKHAQLPPPPQLHYPQQTQTNPSVPSLFKDSKTSYNSSTNAASSLIEAKRRKALEKLKKNHPDSAIVIGSPQAAANFGCHRSSPGRPLDTVADKNVTSIEEKKLTALQKLKSKQAIQLTSPKPAMSNKTVARIETGSDNNQTASIGRTAIQSASNACIQSSHTSNNNTATNQGWAEKFGYQPSTKKLHGMIGSPSKGARLISQINKDNCNEIGFRVKDTDVKRTDWIKGQPSFNTLYEQLISHSIDCHFTAFKELLAKVVIL